MDSSFKKLHIGAELVEYLLDLPDNVAIVSVERINDHLVFDIEVSEDDGSFPDVSLALYDSTEDERVIFTGVAEMVTD